VFKSSVAKIIIIVLFSKTMLIMDFDDYFIAHSFSLLFDLPPNSCGTSADLSCHTNVPRQTGWKSLLSSMPLFLKWSISLRNIRQTFRIFTHPSSIQVCHMGIYFILPDLITVIFVEKYKLRNLIIKFSPSVTFFFRSKQCSIDAPAQSCNLEM
jgi:hypothetical protein